jgi:hypothetical protein
LEQFRPQRQPFFANPGTLQSLKEVKKASQKMRRSASSTSEQQRQQQQPPQTNNTPQPPPVPPMSPGSCQSLLMVKKARRKTTLRNQKNKTKQLQQKLKGKNAVATVHGQAQVSPTHVGTPVIENARKNVLAQTPDLEDDDTEKDNEASEEPPVRETPLNEKLSSGLRPSNAQQGDNDKIFETSHLMIPHPRADAVLAEDDKAEKDKDSLHRQVAKKDAATQDNQDATSMDAKPWKEGQDVAVPPAESTLEEKGDCLPLPATEEEEPTKESSTSSDRDPSLVQHKHLLLTSAEPTTKDKAEDGVPHPSPPQESPAAAENQEPAEETSTLDGDPSTPQATCLSAVSKKPKMEDEHDDVLLQNRQWRRRATFWCLQQPKTKRL